MPVSISHSRQNSGAALKLCDELIRRSITVWLDLRELSADVDWNRRVAEAIRSASAFIFLIGPAGPDDWWQKFEWQQVVEEEYYLDPSKALIPVVFGEAELPGFLNTRRIIGVDESDISFAALADAIVQVLSKPEDGVDQAKLQRGREARVQALEDLRAYSRSLDEKGIKQAGIRVLK